MTKTAIFISTKTGYLEYVGSCTRKNIDFWEGYNQENGVPYQSSRDVYSQILHDDEEEFYLYAIQCHDYKVRTHYEDNGSRYIETIKSFLEVESKNNGKFDNVYLFLHEKDVNSADYLGNKIKNQGIFSETKLLFVWKSTKKGNMQYNIPVENFFILMFQHQPHFPMLDFLSKPITIDRVRKLLNLLSNNHCLEQ